MIPDQEIKDCKILIVDDKRTNITLLEQILTNEGYSKILAITDPRDTVDLYISFKPDLILLDLKMPEMDGFQVMEKIGDISDSDFLPILVLTAHKDMDTRLKALQAGARDFLSKPFDHYEVLCRIRNLIEVILSNRRIADQNKILDRKVREKTLELNNSRLEIIRRLGIAAEYKDPETANHILRMSKVCQLLGQAHGLPQDDVDLLLSASPMHDLGKIGIPDNVLLKPGKLDEQEWEIMKTHPYIGYKILDGHNAKIMNAAKTIALTHHEKWDGTGYPNGLSGDEIPLFGRICAIADVFDALISERPYKKAWPIDAVIEEMKSQRGKHFDPDLLDTFFTILDDAIEVRNQYFDSEFSYS